MIMRSATDLTDKQWAAIAPLLPRPAATGRPRADDRRTLNGILYVLRTGCRWRDLPREYGSPTTCWRRLTRWQREGVWPRIWQATRRTLDADARDAWAQALIDGSFVPGKKSEARAA
jgi:transposase